MILPFFKKNINIRSEKKKALVAPLDWGLGHATRCIPIIRELMRQGFDVIIAAEKGGAVLLNTEFPNLEILPLKGYRVAYTKNESFFFLKMLLQAPKIIQSIYYEHKWLSAAIKNHSFDIIISDNRFGLFNKKARSIFITHQLHIKTGTRLSEKIAQKINYWFINKFNECWVPDEEGTENLGGMLSHPTKMPGIPVSYIGPLSRFEKYTTAQNTDLLIMLSGPEPQRTLLENILLDQVKKIELRIVLVRGLPMGDTIKYNSGDNVKILNHVHGKELNELILSSKMIIARSGYTTVMELAALNKKAILIPTPGQTEQEYLADYLAGKKYCITLRQTDFNLNSALKIANESICLSFPAFDREKLKHAVSGLL